MKSVQEIHAEISKLQHEAVEVMKHHYPVNSTIFYAHGNQVREATVIEHNPYHDRMLVMGAYSGKRYWLDAVRIRKQA